MRIDSRTILVTGGTEGIGQALVQALVERDCQVLTCSRHPQGADAPNAGRVAHFVCDLSSETGPARLAAEITLRHPELSVVINNAGVQHLLDIPNAPASRVENLSRQEIALNLHAPIAVTAGLLPVLRSQPSAAIVNVTTGLALAPKKSSPVYCATKAALRSFTRSLRYQMEESDPHIRVVEALPPLVETRMTAGRGRGKMAPQAVAQAIINGLECGQDEIYIGKTRLLKTVLRVAPSVAYRVLKSW
jgi:uncharacterized oxidoreductase